MKRNYIGLVVYIFASIFFVGVLVWIKSKGELSSFVDEKIFFTEKGNQKNNDSNLVHFRNEILGLEFDYPKDWGEISMSPSNNITNLANVNEEFLDGNDQNDNKYMVTLSFSKYSSTEIKLINDSYPGTFYPSGGAYVYGPMDNFKKLIKSKNICDYEINFYKGVYYAYEIYNSCNKGIKESVIIEGQNNYNYEDYHLKRWGYKRLKNGYFDNMVLLSNVAFVQSNNLSQKMTMEEIKLKDEIDENKFQEDLKDLILLMSSVKTFQPPKPTMIIFENFLNEDPNITIIRKYYHYLAIKELSMAYEMHQNINISFDEFMKWYGQVFKTTVYNVKQTKLNTYKIDVDLHEDNQVPKKYRVVMEVNNNKINTLSSEQIISEEIKFGNLLAYSRLKSDHNEMVLIDNNKEIVIERADNDFLNKIGTTARFYNPRFSPLGNYLLYDTGWWEGMYSNIYDIKNQKILIDPNRHTAYIYEISNNEKFLVNCGESDFDGTLRASIYSFPDLNLKYDFIAENNYNKSRECNLKDGEKLSWGCDTFSCNVKDNVVEFSINSDYNIDPKDKIEVFVKYDLNEERIIN